MPYMTGITSTLAQCHVIIRGMSRMLLQIWPAFIPIAFLLLWYVRKCSQAKKHAPEDAKPQLRDEPWVMTLLISVAIAIICLFTIVLSQDGMKGDYEPAELNNGTLKDGHIR